MKNTAILTCILFLASTLGGETVYQLPFRLELKLAVVALQFDLKTDDPGIELITGELTGSAAGHRLSSAKIAPTTTRFIIHDPNNSAFSSGTFLEMSLGITAPAELKDLRLSLSNLVFANADGTRSMAEIKNPPLIQWRNPSSAGSFPIGQRMNLKVDATDADGRLEVVEFFINDSPLAEDKTYPHEATWDPVAGIYRLRAVVTDNDGLSSETPEIPVRIFSRNELINYEVFKSIYFGENSDNPEISAPGADPDGDAASNLLEYFLSRDPLNPDAQLESFSYLTEEGGNPFMVLQFTTSTVAQDLSVLVQSSGDTAVWVEQLDLTTETTDHGDGTATVVIKVPLQEGSPLAKFLRLVITNE